MTGRVRLDEELLREIADGDLSRIGGLYDDRVGAQKASGLDADAFRVAEIAALVALDAPPISWFVHVGSGATVDIATIVGTLIAIAPIVGTPRIVSAAAGVVAATESVEELDDDELDEALE